MQRLYDVVYQRRVVGDPVGVGQKVVVRARVGEQLLLELAQAAVPEALLPEDGLEQNAPRAPVSVLERMYALELVEERRGRGELVQRGAVDLVHQSLELNLHFAVWARYEVLEPAGIGDGDVHVPDPSGFGLSDPFIRMKCTLFTFPRSRAS